MGLSSVSASNKEDKFETFLDLTVEFDEAMETYFDMSEDVLTPSEHALNAADTFNHLVNIEYEAYGLPTHKCFVGKTDAYWSFINFVQANQTVVAAWLAINSQTVGITIEDDAVDGMFNWVEATENSYIRTFNKAVERCWGDV